MNRFTIIFLLLLYCLGIKAQFSDNFNDNTLESNPLWVGEITKFSNNLDFLQLNGIDDSDVASIYTKSKSIQSSSWQGRVYLDVNPSSSNYAEIIFLATDTSAHFSGYSLRFGGSKDNISLLKILEGKRTSINVGGFSLFNKDSSIVVFKAELLADTLELSIDTLLNGNFFSYFKETIDTNLSPQFFGISCSYTKTRKDKFRFDDFEVKGLPEKTPPKVTRALLENDTTISILFSETIDTTTLEINVTPIESRIYWVNNDLLKINIPRKINSYSVTVTLTSIQDLNGNIGTDTILTFYQYNPNAIAAQSILITEFLPDPTPIIGLPEAEFVELYNRSDSIVFLDGITINGYGIPLGNSIPSKEYLILFKGDSMLFPSEILQVPCPNLPTYLLNNTGDAIVLKDAFGTIIDSLHYSSGWYNITPSDGISLERNSLEPNCGNGSVFWSTSLANSGGTPGYNNSVNPYEKSAPKLEKALWLAPDTLVLTYNQIVKDGNKLGAVLTYKPTSYPLNINVYSHCGLIAAKPFNLTEKPKEAIATINEILFDPYGQGVDFVELKTQTSPTYLPPFSLIELHSNKADTLLIEPLLVLDNYLAITTNKKVVTEQFFHHNQENIVEQKLMNLVNEGGILILQKEGKTIDSLAYNTSFHSPYLSSTDGVALERNYIKKPYWHSAPSTNGFGSPGLANATEGIRQDNTNVYLETNILDLTNAKTFNAIVTSLAGSKIDFSVFTLNGRSMGEWWSIINTNSSFVDILPMLKKLNLEKESYVVLVQVSNESGVKSYKLVFSVRA